MDELIERKATLSKTETVEPKAIMDALKINWAVSGGIATAEIFGMGFTVKQESQIYCHRNFYLVESDSTVNFSEPLFVEFKAVGIHCAKKLAEEIIVEFICDELRKANEDE